jgi:hypothetical protein
VLSTEACFSLSPPHAPPQGILAAVLSALLGSKDPDQVATMAKQAGEVSAPTDADTWLRSLTIMLFFVRLWYVDAVAMP